MPELAQLAADAGRPARRLPHRRAGRGDAGARRHRPPLPRRCRPLPRQRHDGHRRPTTTRARSGGRDAIPDVFDAAVAAAVEVIREVRPQVVVTYDENGDYGHPDHIMAHRVATAAVAARGRPGVRRRASRGTVAKLYWTATPKSVLRARARGAGAASRRSRSASPTSTTCRSASTTSWSPPRSTRPATASRSWPRCAAHRTQIAVDGAVLRAVEPARPRDRWRSSTTGWSRGELGPDRDADGRETDLFAGLELPA